MVTPPGGSTGLTDTLEGADEATKENDPEPDPLWEATELADVIFCDDVGVGDVVVVVPVISLDQRMV